MATWRCMNCGSPDHQNCSTPKPAPAADPQQSASSTQGELDCGDNSCYFAKNKTGMRTNHGCRCFDKAGLRTRSTVAAAIEMLPKYLAMQAQLTQLRAELEKANGETSNHMACAMSYVKMNTALRSDLALAREALENDYRVHGSTYAANALSRIEASLTTKESKE